MVVDTTVNLDASTFEKMVIESVQVSNVQATTVQGVKSDLV